jgi:hypothetical protein
MATPTYELIDSTVLGSASASVTFSSIPAAYRDLVLVWEAKGSGGNAGFDIKFNSDAGSNYNQVDMSSLSGGISGSQSNVTDISLIANASTSEAFLGAMQLLDYSATDKHKSGLIRDGRAGSSTNATAIRYASTSAITAIQISTGFNNYASGSSFYLYGIAA